MVHNLGLVDWQHPDGSFGWAEETMTIFRQRILAGDHRGLVDYPSLGKAVRLAIPTPEHFLPMLYVLGLQEERDAITMFNDKTVMGSIAMTSFTLAS
jgi:4,5-DOPA dioxygenase extradiol